MANNTARLLRGLILSAIELRTMHPDWTDAMIEDYLNIFNNLTLLADEVDTKSGIIKETVLVTSSPYTPEFDSEVMFCDTNFGAINIQLPEGVSGYQHRIINTGRSNNNVTVSSTTSEAIFGETVPFALYDAEVIDICFESTQGWH